MISPLRIHLGVNVAQQSMPIGKEVAWVSLPTYSPGMKLLVPHANPVNVCLPALPHPVCEWTPSFKCSLLSRHKRFYTDFTVSGPQREVGEGDHTPPKENKPVYTDLLPGVYPHARWAPYLHSILLAPDSSRVAGGCCSSCMRDAFLISTYLGLRAPTLFLICL